MPAASRSLTLTLALLLSGALLALDAVVPAPPRWLDVLVFLALLTALGGTGWRLARRLLLEESGLATAVAAFSLAVAGGSLPAILLGHFGHLRPSWYLMTIAGLTLAAVLLRSKSPGLDSPAGEGLGACAVGKDWRSSTPLLSSPHPLPPARPGGRDARRTIFAIREDPSAEGSSPLGGVVGGDGGRTGGGWNCDDPFLPRTLLALSRIARFETVLVLAVSGALALGLLNLAYQLRFEPVGAFGGDDISYHMGAVATWLRHGDLRMIKFDFGDRSTAFYPILAEICSWVFVVPFRDSDFAARWTQLPFFLASLVALASIARRIGLSPRSAAFAGLFYASIYRVMPVLAFTAGNDHATSFFTLAALDGALGLARSPSRGRAAITGLALGLLVGTKYIGLFYAATIVLLLLVLFFAVPANRALLTTGSGWRRLLAWTGTLAGIALVAGGYTYLRNAWTVGNPLFPAPVHLLGLPGWESATLAFRRTRDSFHFDLWKYLTDRGDLLGPLFPYTLLPAALLAPIVALGRLGRSRGEAWIERLETAVVVLFPLVLFLEFMELMDDHRDSRYWLPGLGLIAVGLVWLTERLADRLPRVAVVVRTILLVLVFHQIDKRLDLSYGAETVVVFALLAAATLFVLWRNRLPRRTGPALAAAALAVFLLLLPPLARGIDKFQILKLRAHPAELALEQAVGLKGATVSYVAFNQPYLFFGSQLQNDVQIVPTVWDLRSQYYSWGGNAEFPFDYPEFRRWWRILDALDVHYLVLRRSGGEEPQRSWILGRPDRFQVIYQDAQDEVYRLVRGDG